MAHHLITNTQAYVKIQSNRKNHEVTQRFKTAGGWILRKEIWTPSKEWPIRGHSRGMLPATSNIQPPGIESSWTTKQLRRQLPRNPQLLFFLFSSSLPSLVVTPHIDCTLCWHRHRFWLPKNFTNLHLLQIKTANIVYQHIRLVLSKVENLHYFNITERTFIFWDLYKL